MPVKRFPDEVFCEVCSRKFCSGECTVDEGKLYLPPHAHPKTGHVCAGSNNPAKTQEELDADTQAELEACGLVPDHDNFSNEPLPDDEVSCALSSELYATRGRGLACAAGDGFIFVKAPDAALGLKVGDSVPLGWGIHSINLDDADRAEFEAGLGEFFAILEQKVGDGSVSSEDAEEFFRTWRMPGSENAGSEEISGDESEPFAEEERRLQ